MNSIKILLNWQERVLAETGAALEDASRRLGCPLPMPGTEIMRMSAEIAHGLALEQLLNHEKVDKRLIDAAFASLRQPRLPAGG